MVPAGSTYMLVPPVASVALLARWWSWRPDSL